MKFILKIFFVLTLLSCMFISKIPIQNIFADDSKSIRFTSSLDSTNQAPGGKLKFKVCATANLNYIISAFKFNLNFDDSQLTYKDIQAYDIISAEHFKLRNENGSMVAIYLEDQEGMKMEKDKFTPLFEITFIVNENIDYDLVDLECNVDCAFDSDCQEIAVSNEMDQRLTVTKALPKDSSLISLIPSSGNLSPEFNSDITNYSVDVDSSVDSITFEALPADETSTVKINKKNLGSQGSTTEISISVTTSDKISSTVYSVSVNRLPKNSQVKEATVGASNSNKVSASKSSTSSKVSTNSNGSNNSNNNKSVSSMAASKEAAGATVKNVSEKKSVNPYTEIGHNIVMRKNSFDVYLMFVLMCCCIGAAIFLIKKNKVGRK